MLRRVMLSDNGEWPGGMCSGRPDVCGSYCKWEPPGAGGYNEAKKAAREGGEEGAGRE